MWMVVRIPAGDITNLNYNFVVAKPLVQNNNKITNLGLPKVLIIFPLCRDVTLCIHQVRAEIKLCDEYYSKF